MVSTSTARLGAPGPPMPPRRLDAVHRRHADVHEHHVGPGARAARPPRRRLGLADHVDVVLRVEDHAEAGPHERLVVDDEDPDHGAPPRRERARDPRSRRRARPGLELRRRRRRRVRACRRGRGRRRRRAGAASAPSSLISSSSRVGLVARRRPRRARAGVLEHVGERLLDDAVRRQVDAVGHGASCVPATVRSTASAGVADARHSIVEVVEAGLGLGHRGHRGRRGCRLGFVVARAGRRAVGASRCSASRPRVRCGERPVAASAGLVGEQRLSRPRTGWR